MNQVANKKQKHIRLVKLVFAAAAAASFGMATAHAAPAAGWTETRTKGFLPLVQQNEAGTAGAPAASTAAAAAAAIEMAPGESVDIVLGLNLRNEAQLDQYLHDLHTPGSPHYRQFLTPAQFAAQYAPTDQQVASVVAHLRKAGFVNIVVAPNRLLVSASGTAATIKSAFRTTLKRFTRNGRSVYANTDAAQVPNAIGGIVGAVLGLQNVELMHTGAGSQPQGNTSNLGCGS
ncbi:MAG: peptidase S53, partial [Burkholderia sp.]|nr:peptidase S53 [Burkholderia sp.]